MGRTILESELWAGVGLFFWFRQCRWDSSVVVSAGRIGAVERWDRRYGGAVFGPSSPVLSMVMHAMDRMFERRLKCSGLLLWLAVDRVW